MREIDGVFQLTSDLKMLSMSSLDTAVSKNDDLKKKKFTVSMQKYHPSLKLVLPCRYHNISFGLGTRTPNENISIKGNPGPGAYNIPGCFDKGLKGKPVLN